MIDRKSPIFICGNVKAGTTLVQSLLDSHPELFVIPIELKFFKFAALPTLSPHNTLFSPKVKPAVPLQWSTSRKAADIVSDIISHKDFERLLAGTKNNRGIIIKQDEVDRSKLSKCLNNIEKDSLRNTYMNIVSCIYESTKGNTKNSPRFVEKTPHLEEYCQEINRWFEAPKFLHVMRNPYANIYSLRKSDSIVSDLRGEVYGPTAKSYYFMEKNKKNIEKYKVVKYEDVVLDTRNTI